MAAERRLRAAVAAALVLPVLAGCTGDAPAAKVVEVTASPKAGAPTTPQEPTPSYAVERPGRLTQRLLGADVLITASTTLPDRLVRRIRAVKGVNGVLPLSLSTSSVEGRTLTVAAVDPGQFRRYTPAGSARAAFVWNGIAAGAVALDPQVGRRLVDDAGTIRLGTQDDAPHVPVTAFAPLVQQSVGPGTTRPAIQAVVNERRGDELGVPRDNALLVSTGTLTPSALTAQFRRIVGDRATVRVLALELALAKQTAVLTGGSVTDVVGTFSYTDRGNGEVTPDPAWVREYIRTERVPILGEVTCNKGMLPQLRGALEDVVRAGLASQINPDEYAGCYYPRYIGRDPANGLSLHSWGIAVDLNVPGNLRGTAGEMDRQVVAIFKKWGFAWGGDWRYTDPMHFEMNAVVRPAGG